MGVIKTGTAKVLWPGIKKWWQDELKFQENATEADHLRRRVKRLEQQLEYEKNYNRCGCCNKNPNW